LEAMMQAAVKAETKYTNIRTIASKAMGGTPRQAFQAQAHASQAERTLTPYGTGDEGSHSTIGQRGKGSLCCYIRNGIMPHLWGINLSHIYAREVR
jgi:hypothetical protein